MRPFFRISMRASYSANIILLYLMIVMFTSKQRTS